jgi:DNA-binding beta-propeller fold protein YncE
MIRSFFAVSLSLVVFASAATTHAAKVVLVAGGDRPVGSLPATESKLDGPFGVDFNRSGEMFIVEISGHRVMKVDTSGILTLVAGTGAKGDSGDGGPALKATFNGMHSLAVAPDGQVYVADTWNNRVRRIDPKTGTIHAFAGTGKKAYGGDGGPAVEALCGGVFCICFDAGAENMYLVDLDNKRVRKVNMASGVMTLVAGNGTKGVPADGSDAATSPLADPRAVAVDSKGNVYILERNGNALRVVDPQGKIRTVAGTGKPGLSGDGGDALAATLKGPKHLCIDLDDNVIIADTANHVIRKYTPKDGKIVRVAGTGKKGSAGVGGSPLELELNEPHGVLVDRNGTLFITDSYNNRVLKIVD